VIHHAVATLAERADMDRSMQTPNSDEGVSVLRRADPGRRDRLPVLRQRRGSARCAPKEWRAQDDRALAGARLVQPRPADTAPRGWDRTLQPHLVLGEGRGVIRSAHVLARSRPRLPAASSARRESGTRRPLKGLVARADGL